MKYIAAVVLVLPTLAIQLFATALPVSELKASLSRHEVHIETPEAFNSVLTNWAHFGQTDFPDSTQPVAVSSAPMARLPINTIDEILPLGAPKLYPVRLNGTSVTNDDWPPFFADDDEDAVSFCDDAEGWRISEADGPEAHDCAALRNELDDNPGFWNVTADPGRVDQYVLLANHDSCGFMVMAWSNVVDNL